MEGSKGEHQDLKMYPKVHREPTESQLRERCAHVGASAANGSNHEPLTTREAPTPAETSPLKFTNEQKLLR